MLKITGVFSEPYDRQIITHDGRWVEFCSPRGEVQHFDIAQRAYDIFARGHGRPTCGELDAVRSITSDSDLCPPVRGGFSTSTRWRARPSWCWNCGRGSRALGRRREVSAEIHGRVTCGRSEHLVTRCTPMAACETPQERQRPRPVKRSSFSTVATHEPHAPDKPQVRNPRRVAAVLVVVLLDAGRF